jgi:hypothetical protein
LELGTLALKPGKEVCYEAESMRPEEAIQLADGEGEGVAEENLENK